MTDAPYRKPGEPAPIPKELRRWFTKSADVAKGPFEASAVRKSLREGYIKPTTLVRAEDEREWRVLSSVDELNGRGVPARPKVSFDDDREVLRVQPTGTFWGGFAITILFGLLAMVIVLVASKEPETRRGAVRGYLTRICLTMLVVCVGLAAKR